MKRTVLLVVGLAAVLSSIVMAAVPQLINFQGILRDGSGNPVANGSYSVIFTVYDSSTVPPGIASSVSASVLWTETQSVTTNNGLFNVLLGSVTPIPDSVFNDSSRYLGIKVGADPEMTPWLRLSSVGYSYNSSEWTSAAGSPFLLKGSGASSYDVLYRLNGNVGIGTSNPLAKLDVLNTGSDAFDIKGIQSQVENASSGNAYGGYFVTSTAGTGYHYGVFARGSGSSTSGTPYGLYGLASGSSISYTATGCYGEANNSGDAYGGYFTGTSTGGFPYIGYGVYGNSPAGYGVYGNGFIGVSGYSTVSDGEGVLGWADNGAGAIGVHGRSSSGYAGYFNGQVYVNGNFTATGVKSAAVKADNGEYRLLYAQEATENWFEDFGTAQLVNGKATVNIDPLYAQTVNTAVTYHVFLTPEGDCRGLYVTGKTPASFEMRELQNGKSNLSVSYRIVAKRKGYENVRLAKFEGPTPEEVQAKDVKMRAEMAKENAKREQEQAKMEAERKLHEEERAKMEQERLIQEQKVKENK